VKKKGGVVEYVVFDDEGQASPRRLTRFEATRRSWTFWISISRERTPAVIPLSTINEDGGLSVVYNPPSSA